MEINNNWNLADIYADPAVWDKELKEMLELADKLAAMKGSLLSSAETLYQALELHVEMESLMNRLFIYASCEHDTDMSNASARERFETIFGAVGQVGEKLAFCSPELMDLTMDRFDAFCKVQPALSTYRHYIEDLLSQKAHILDEKTESILVRLDDLSGAFKKVYSDLFVNDTEYPVITDPEGNEVTVNNASYGSALLNPDRDFRKQFFNILLGDIYGKKINTVSSNYYGQVKSDVAMAKSRNYPTARALSLDANHVPEEVYDNLIETVRANTAPLQEYVSLRKELLSIDDLHFYDLFVPIVKDTDRKYFYEEGCEYLRESTRILGEDYTELVDRSIKERWSDVYPAKNKETGAYSTGGSGVPHPYMLLNYDNTLDDVFTLVHETGHSMHTWYSCQNQPDIYSGYSIFCAEVASTTNEMLLYHYMLERSQSKEEKALLLSKHLDDVRSTFYRQTMFADFELQTHRLVEAGKPLLPEGLCEIYRQLNVDYYGPNFAADKTISYEWARIPHFYRAFYVYQYATGISAAIAISRRILREGAAAVADYKKFLSSGSSEHPIELLRYAGVDMASPQPVLDTISDFKETLTQLRDVLK